MAGNKELKNEFPRPVEEGEEALAPHLVEEAYPTGWKAPRLTLYNGTMDPEDHLSTRFT